LKRESTKQRYPLGSLGRLGQAPLSQLSYPHIPRVLVLWCLKYMCGPYVCRVSCELPCLCPVFFFLGPKNTFVCQPEENSPKMLYSISSTKKDANPRWINPNTNLDSGLIQSCLQRTKVMADFHAKVFLWIPRNKKLYSPRPTIP
jgi:hypothetical protein